MNRFYLLKGANGCYYRPSCFDNTDRFTFKPRYQSAKEERRAFIRKKCGKRR